MDVRPQLRNRNDRALNILMLICMTLIQTVKQVWLLPQTVANAFKLRRRQIVRNEHEIERLDRLRNPSKYLGK
jgi:hypothetical protein